MKITISTLSLLFYFITSFSQKNEVRETVAFSKIEVRNGILVQLTKSDKPSVKITTEANLSDVITEVKDGKLILRIEKGKKNTSVEVFYTNIIEIEGYAKSEISTSSLIKQDSLIVILETGAKAYLDLDVKKLTSKLTEGAVLTAEGYSIYQDAYATTGATLSLYDLESEEITIKVTGNGKAKINVAKSLNAEATSGGYISYKGKPAKWDNKTNLGGKIEEFSE